MKFPPDRVDWDQPLFNAWYASVISCNASFMDSAEARLWWERISARYLEATGRFMMGYGGYDEL